MLAGARWQERRRGRRLPIRDAPNSLVAVAYSYLASMMARREEVRECEGCGRLFLSTRYRQRYCEKNCSMRKRVSKHPKQSRTS
jgi:hypothetical protein